MKKVLAVLLALMMLIPMFVSCGGGKKDPTVNPTETTTPVETNSEQKEAERLALIEKLKTSITDYSHCKEVVYMDLEEICKQNPQIGECSVDDILYYPTANQHPRVFFNSSMIDTIKANLTNPENAIEYAEYVKDRDDESIIERALKGDDVGFADEVIEAKALAYILEGDTLRGYEAIYLVKVGLLGIGYVPANFDISDGPTRSHGEHICSIAKVYDWCYDLLTAEEKEMFYAGVQNVLAPWMEISFPPSAKSQSSITSHSSEAQLLRDWLSLAIAVYDEYPNAYEFVGARFFSQYVPFRNYYYESNFYHQGTSYGTYRFQWDCYSAWLMYAMTGGEYVYIDNMQNVPVSFGYLIRPDGMLMRLGDDGKQQRYGNLSTCATILASLYKNGYCKYLENEYAHATWYRDDYGLSPVEHLIINDPSVKAKSFEELPLTTYLGSPLGQMIVRTGWDMADPNSDDVMVLMRVGETYVTNHDHYDAGVFQIYYKGALAIDSGSENMTDYTKGTIAHNCLLIGTESEYASKEYAGQRWFESECQSWSLWNKSTKTGPFREANEVIAQESVSDNTKTEYAYISGNLTSGYSRTSASEVIRSMLFVPTEDENVKGLFFVFDKLTSKGSDAVNVKKTFLLHMRQEPIVDSENNTVTIITDAEINSNYIKYKANGRLVDQLLPMAGQTYNYEAIGGPGKSEYYNGNNFRTSPLDPSELSDDGWGRVEISTKGNKTSYFFNVMTIGDNNNSAIPEATLFENDTHAAALIMNTVAVFSKTGYAVDESFSIDISAEGADLTYYVTNLEAGEWTVENAGSTQVLTATEDGQMIRFTAKDGVVTFTKTK